VQLRTSLCQLFAPLQLNLEEVVQIIELRRFGGAPNGYPFAALDVPVNLRSRQASSTTINHHQYNSDTMETNQREGKRISRECPAKISRLNLVGPLLAARCLSASVTPIV
jgi:hypothetical protein